MNIQKKLTGCESEIASINAEFANTEKNYDAFTQEHSIKVDAVRERIRTLRKDQNGDDKGCNNLPPGIRDDLDCICCYKAMGGKGAVIYQCAEGHLICPKCHQRLMQCPVCRKPYQRPGIRNRMAESIANFVNN